MNTNLAPWCFAAITAIWFGVLAARAQRNWVLWAIGGGLFALVITTIVFGVARATLLPVSHDVFVRVRLKAAAVSLLLVLVFGWLFTNNLHGHVTGILNSFFKKK